MLAAAAVNVKLPVEAAAAIVCGGGACAPICETNVSELAETVEVLRRLDRQAHRDGERSVGGPGRRDRDRRVVSRPGAQRRFTATRNLAGRGSRSRAKCSSQLAPLVVALNCTAGPVPVTLIDPAGNVVAPAIELRFREAGESGDGARRDLRLHRQLDGNRDIRGSVIGVNHDVVR